MGRMTSEIVKALSNHANVRDLDEAMKRAKKCGVGSRYGFALQNGDRIFIPKEAGETFFRFESYKVTLKNGTREDRDIFFVGCMVNDKAKWVPMWALRKGPNSRSEFSDDMENNSMYRSFVEDSMTDWDRYEEVAGKTFEVKVATVTTKKKDKEYNMSVFLLVQVEEEAAPSAPKKGRKSSK
jgi:hypothetical protein